MLKVINRHDSSREFAIFAIETLDIIGRHHTVEQTIESFKLARSPGMSAIKAVLAPEKTEYLYFVAEKDGHHRFSKTYNEHLRAIREIG